MVIHFSDVAQEIRQEGLGPFSELILSWNGERPLSGGYTFLVKIKEGENWSELKPYAYWGADGQKSFQKGQDIIEASSATGFEITINCGEGAKLSNIHSIHVYTKTEDSTEVALRSLEAVALNVLGLSQMALDHPKNASLCAPTSTVAIVRHLLKDQGIDPLTFADQSYDQGADIHGNWVLNVAEASNHLGKEWEVWVSYLHSFAQIYEQLEKGVPVIVSIRGPIEGSAKEYNSGHLIVVTGFDPLENNVLCMDPAFSEDGKTCVSYKLSNFEEAWKRRNQMAFIFKKKELVSG